MLESITAPLLACDIVEPIEQEDSIDPTESAEPMEQSEPTEPTEPMLNIDPVDPIDNNDPVDPRLHWESRPTLLTTRSPSINRATLILPTTPTPDHVGTEFPAAAPRFSLAGR